MSCGSCESHDEKSETQNQYKCKSCGSAGNKPENCCGKPKEKACVACECPCDMHKEHSHE